MQIDFPGTSVWLGKRDLFTDGYMEGGYGAWSDQVAETIRKVYETDGVYLDMTYTGKAFHGMMNYIRENNIRGKISSSCTPADFRCF